MRRFVSGIIAVAICGIMIRLLLTTPPPPPPERTHSIFFLVDISDGISEPMREEIASDIRNRLSREEERSVVGMILFAGATDVVMPPTAKKSAALDDAIIEKLFIQRHLARLKTGAGEGDSSPLQNMLSLWKERMRTSATDIEAAIRSVLSLIPDHNDAEIVLYTDGNETDGDFSRVEIGDGIKLSAPRMTGVRFNDAAITEIDFPSSVKLGEPVSLRLHVTSTYPTSAKLSLFVNNSATPIVTTTTQIAAGATTVPIGDIPSDAFVAGRSNSIRVFMYPEGDSERRSNYAAVAFPVIGRPEILLVEVRGGALASLAELLKAQGIGAKRVSADELGNELLDTIKFDAIVLSEPLPDDIPPQTYRLLDRYVRESGGGLLLSCPPEMSPPHALLSKLLPVSLAGSPPPPTPPPAPPEEAPPQSAPEPKKVEAPAITLFLLVDKSGSMAGDNIALVKEACIAAAQTLSDADSVVVVAFDGMPHTVLPPTSASRMEYIADRISRLMAGGGTRLLPALQSAADMVKTINTPIKHMIVLTDGLVEAADFRTIAESLRKMNVTISTVCVGSSEFDPLVPSQLASIGGGRFLFTNDFKRVPQIFTNETQFVVTAAAQLNKPPVAKPLRPPPTPAPKPTTTNKPSSQPTVVLPKGKHEILTGFDGERFPALRGFVQTTAHETAQTILATPEEKPILIFWRYGLGKVAVWTSDMGGEWSDEFFRWEDAPKLFSQAIRFLSIPRDFQRSPIVKELPQQELLLSGFNGAFFDAVRTKGEKPREERAKGPAGPPAVLILAIAVLVLIPISIFLRREDHDRS